MLGSHRYDAGIFEFEIEIEIRSRANNNEDTRINSCKNVLNTNNGMLVAALIVYIIFVKSA